MNTWRPVTLCIETLIHLAGPCRELVHGYRLRNSAIATLARAGLVLFSGMGTDLRLPETQAGFLECRTQFRDCVGSHAMQFAHLRLGLLRYFGNSGETGAFECSPGGRRQADEESFLRFALRLHTSFAYTMKPKFFATLSYSVRPGVFVVCVCQYTRLQPASLAIS